MNLKQIINLFKATMKIKGVFLICLLLISSALLRAQNTKINTSFSNQGDFYSANNSESSGQLALNIPLCILESYGISLPISLNYSYTGFRPGERASWVGNGWHLSGIPNLSRSVNGFPDDKKIQIAGLTGGQYEGGYLFNGRSLEGPWLENEKVHISANRIDLIPDLFQYSLITGGGTFALKRNEQTMWNPIPVQFPYTNNKIIPTLVEAGLSNFLIKDNNGHSYSFSEAELSSIAPSADSPCSEGPIMDVNGSSSSPSYTGSFRSAWLISRIKNIHNDVCFDFTYGNHERIVNTYLNSAKRNEHGVASTCADIYKQQKRYIERIDFETGHIEFVQSSQYRLDLSNHKALDEIRLYSNDIAYPVLKIQFFYSYMYFNSSTNPNASDFRLTLTEVKFMNSSGELIKHLELSYFLQNHGGYSLTAAEILNYSDHWGYFNGAFQNTNPWSLGTSNREPNLEELRRGALHVITERTSGNSTEIIYENSDFSSYGDGTLAEPTTEYPLGKRHGPGLRLQAIIHDDLNGFAIMTKYFYSQFENSNKSSGILTDKLIKSFKVNPNNLYGWVDLLFSESLVSGSFAGEPKIIYTNVEQRNCTKNNQNEWNCNSNSLFGHVKNWYTYESTPQQIAAPFTPRYRPYWRQGLPSKSIFYDSSNAAIHENEYQYEKIQLGEFIPGAKLLRFTLTTGSNYSYMLSSDNFLWPSEVLRLKLRKIREYSNSQIQSETSTEYFYKTFDHLLVDYHEETLTNDEVYRKYFRYNGDFDILPSASNSQLVAIRTFKEIFDLKNIPVESSLFKMNSDNQLELLSSDIYFYTFFDGSYVPQLNKILSSDLEHPILGYEFAQPQVILGPVYEYSFHFDDELYNERLRILTYGLNHQPTNSIRNQLNSQSTILNNKYRQLASIDNSEISQSLYTSFEDSYHGGWNVSIPSYNGSNGPANAASGNKYYRLNTDHFNSGTTHPGLSPGKYILSYWYKGALPTVSLSNSGTPGTPSETNWEEWTYVEQILEWTTVPPSNISGNFLTIGAYGGTETFIDELRLHPIDATMNTTGYYPDGKLMYECSPGGDIVTYEYDSKGRLQWALNKERKVIEYHEYAEKNPDDINSFNKHTVYTTRRDNITKNEVLNSQINHHDIKKSVSYANGFGRHRQTIDFNIGSSSRERISFSEYDPLGRELRKYLPYYDHLQENDAYIPNAKTAQQAHYTDRPDPNEETSFPYVETKVENSPFQRPTERSGLGTELHPEGSGGQGNTTRFEYGWNTDEPIRKWVYNHQTRQVSSAGIYPAGHLTFVKTIDPNGISTWQWTDATGKKVASMQELRFYEVLDNDADGNFDVIPTNIQQEGVTQEVHPVISYVVYNDFGRVVYEIPALAIERMGNTYVLDPSNPNDIFNENITHYVYDKKGRVIEKYTPGQGLTTFVYNRYDEMILSQDAQQRAQTLWSFVKKDSRHRVVLKGEFTSVLDRANHQSNADNAEWATKRVAPTSGIFGYDDTAYPSIIAAVNVFNVYYYDDYNFTKPSNFNFAAFTGNSSHSNMLRGMPTGSITRIFGYDANIELLTTVSYYDKKGRPIQAYTQNHTGGFDRVDSYYNELGQVVKTVQQHKYESNSNAHTFTTRYEYNAQDGSLKNTFCKLDNDPEVWVSSRWYDDSGKLKTLKLHKESGVSNFLQTLNYRYNAQGWLTHINNTALIVDPYNLENYDVFGQEIDYFGKSDEYSPNSTYQRIPQYNGNVSAMMWNAKGHETDGTMTERYGYVFRYDEFGRMREGLFVSDDPSSPGLFNQGLQLYDEKLSYDLGGNVRTLWRTHDGGTGLAMPTDNLTYNYNNGGYRLKQVNDGGHTTTSALFKHFLNGSNVTDQYTYDQSGRTLHDRNRGVIFDYNPIGLPTRIVKTGSLTDGVLGYPFENVLYYTYDAAGNKLRKTIDIPACPPVETTRCIGPATIHTDYIGNFVYENGELKMIYHPEGVIRPTSEDATNTTEYVYDYFVKDYLGNVRVVVTEENATLTQKFLATLEEAQIVAEQENFDNLPENQTPRPVNYPINGSSELNEYVARIAADNEVAIGPAMLMPVKTGDRVQARVEYFYEGDAPGTTYSNIGNFVQEVLLSMIAAGSGTLPLTETQLMGIANPAGVNATALTNFFGAQMDTTAASMERPHAYLVWLAYSNNFTFRPQGSGAIKVEDPDQLRTLLTNELTMTHNGYLHIYVSNGSSKGVNFNDFLITTARGKTRQINDYYPYGLAIAGLHSDENEYLNKYTAKELQSGDFDPSLGTGLEMFDFHARFYDPQLGRWFTPDPAEQFANPYLAMGNNPIMYKDPNGEWVHIVIGAVIGGTVNWIANGASFDAKGLGYFGVGALAGGLAAGIGAGVSSALVSGSGGSFAAGFAGTTAVSSTGFAAGAVTGAASGVTSGFITGTGNALVGGDNIGQALDNGLNSAWKQGLSGAAVGGVIGGFQAKGQGKDFWTGSTKDKVVVQIKADGTVIDKSATEHIVMDPNNPGQVDPIYYKNHRTMLNDPNHPTISTTANPDGTFEFTTTLPKRLDITGYAHDPNNALFISQNGRNLSMDFMSRPNDVMLIGNRFHNRPISNVGDLFNTGNLHNSWQSRMTLPISKWW
jgi:RHS repeat-associated protein